ncbi:hypothetical protein, unlikely [Trypanosoma brucei gambiense DAL972]|uniref:Uncharacterized protein n=1 Tax=Trypanosoma brucei gambiense (strain MHOM/CI/86/DAL972) TaxID=679716 RepID=C9ZPW8_TRYB9|nr:hypothetical protein, unlikely [Trypanosoma brucei gambiense DAL972]CBH11446.1 hypothetical protein, unlikely [Trypanosoma brucei gambiense DAL972]|eukprot:XP_011773733.1 hypothetical protein, unlikely [Trypanosoma brucei gambiense DAL972]
MSLMIGGGVDHRCSRFVYSKCFFLFFLFYFLFTSPSFFFLMRMCAIMDRCHSKSRSMTLCSVCVLLLYPDSYESIIMCHFFFFVCFSFPFFFLPFFIILTLVCGCVIFRMAALF